MISVDESKGGREAERQGGVEGEEGMASLMSV